MRKDRIEEKLRDLENEIRVLKSEYRQDMMSIVSELRKFQEIVLEERMYDLREELSRGYQQITLDNNIACSARSFDEKLLNPCPMDAREKCMRVFLEHLQTIALNLKSSMAEGIKSSVQTIYACDTADLKMLEKEPCKHCYDVYLRERENLVAMAEKLARYKESLISRNNNVYISQLPDDVVISSIIDPLSHEARFRMLKSLSSGSMSYKDLTEVTGYEGGHLLYHLNKLITAGLVIKNESSGRYTISGKGMGVMELIKKLYCE